ERSVEERARELADPLRIVGSDRDARRAAADREVRIADFRRHGSRDLTRALQVVREAHGHAAQFVLQLFPVGDVSLERLLGAERDAFARRLEGPGIDSAGPIAEERSDLAGEEALELVVRERGEGADRLQAGR